MAKLPAGCNPTIADPALGKLRLALREGSDQFVWSDSTCYYVPQGATEMFDSRWEEIDVDSTEFDALSGCGYIDIEATSGARWQIKSHPSTRFFRIADHRR